MGPGAGSLTRGSGLGSVLPTQTRSVAPEPLEVVVRALLGTEDVHHDIDVIEEPPPRAGFAFAPDRTDSESVPDLTFDALDHRLHLPLGTGRADHEEVGDHDQLVDIQDDDVIGLLVR